MGKFSQRFFEENPAKICFFVELSPLPGLGRLDFIKSCLIAADLLMNLIVKFALEF